MVYCPRFHCMKDHCKEENNIIQIFQGMNEYTCDECKICLCSCFYLQLFEAATEANFIWDLPHYPIVAQVPEKDTTLINCQSTIVAGDHSILKNQCFYTDLKLFNIPIEGDISPLRQRFERSLS